MPVENAEVARLFRRAADLLELKGENPFRIRAYQGAARTVEELPRPVEELIADSDGKRLTELPGIGADLAGKIEEIVHTGTFSTLAQLERKVPKGLTELIQGARARAQAGSPQFTLTSCTEAQVPPVGMRSLTPRGRYVGRQDLQPRGRHGLARRERQGRRATDG